MNASHKWLAFIVFRSMMSPLTFAFLHQKPSFSTSGFGSVQSRLVYKSGVRSHHRLSFLCRKRRFSVACRVATLEVATHVNFPARDHFSSTAPEEKKNTSYGVIAAPKQSAD